MRKMKKPTWGKLILKLAGILFLGMFFVSGLLVLLENVAEGKWEDDTARMIQICDRYYYERDFAGLRDELELYDLYSEAFDPYWEVVDGYNDYLAWIQWSKAAEMGLPDGEKNAAAYERKVYENLQNVKFDSNVSILQGFADQIEERK